MRAHGEPTPLTTRYLFACLLTCVSAIPSFLIAHSIGCNVPGMLVGIAMYCGIHCSIARSSGFSRLLEKPFVHTTLVVGLITRALIAVPYWPGMSIDLVAGMITSGIVGAVVPIETFTGSLLTTLAQGTVLSLLLAIYLLIVQGLQRAFRRVPAHYQPYACRQCGYDLSHTPEKCPECGWVPDARWHKQQAKLPSVVP